MWVVNQHLDHDSQESRVVLKFRKPLYKFDKQAKEKHLVNASKSQNIKSNSLQNLSIIREINCGMEN